MNDAMEIVGLISIGWLPKEERLALNPVDFPGYEMEAAALIENPKEAAKTIVAKYWKQVEWKSGSLPMALVNQFMKTCKQRRNAARIRQQGREQDKLERALRIVEFQRANGGLSEAVVSAAEAVIAMADQWGIES